jgi:hypothetical protein
MPRHRSRPRHGGRVMDWPKVCREVRGAPRGHRKVATDRLPAMGGAAVDTRNIACLDPFLSRLPDGRSNRSLIQLSDSLRGPHGPSTAARAPLRPIPGPDLQPSNENAELKDDEVVSNRTLPFHRCGVRAPGRKTKQRLEPARCGGCDLRFLFPQGSRHLPFPFFNARVEVGPTVKEG